MRGWFPPPLLRAFTTGMSSAKLAVLDEQVIRRSCFKGEPVRPKGRPGTKGLAAIPSHEETMHRSVRSQPTKAPAMMSVP